MPARPVRKTPLWAKALGWAILGGLGWWICMNPKVLIYLGMVALLCGLLMWDSRREERRMAALKQFLAEVREGESICTFARSFDWRHTDTWILRAVYEEMSEWFPNVPIRRTDRWADLRIDLEDLNEFLIYDIAFRARRSMDNPDQNPLWGKVHTVGDIVAFLEHQPRLADAAPAAA
jgi:hypothetical protein